ncbi:MAG: COX15/CtaA family protein, partial [Bacteroidota bacterium]
RLTDSGLSITEWEVIQGTLPPLNPEQWDEAFEKYKIAARRQYETLHKDMTLSEFKVIYFWEYFHRLWARMIGLVFFFPFVYFMWKKMIPGWLVRRLGVVILLAITAATFGWIMVASGLNEDTRTWVSAYKLVAHLSIATTLFGYLFWTWLKASQPSAADGHFRALKRNAWGITGVLIIQIIFGGLMAGMRAGLIHPHFPYFVQGARFVESLMSSGVDAGSLVNYEPALSIKAWVQVFHRATAYLLVILIIQFFVKARKMYLSRQLYIGIHVLISLLVIQFSLGVLTIINSIGRIP